MNEYIILKDNNGNEVKIETPTTPNPIIINDTINKKDIVIIILQLLFLLFFIIGVAFRLF